MSYVKYRKKKYVLPVAIRCVVALSLWSAVMMSNLHRLNKMAIKGWSLWKCCNTVSWKFYTPFIHTPFITHSFIHQNVFCMHMLRTGKSC